MTIIVSNPPPAIPQEFLSVALVRMGLVRLITEDK